MIILHIILAWLIPLFGLLIHYSVYPKYWANKFELEIRSQKMSVEDFDYWLTTKFFAWPFKIFELCG